jgi:hypothetical protein
MMSLRHKGRNSWKQIVLLAVAGCVVALLVTELSVRIATDSLFAWGNQAERYAVMDPVVGRIPRAGVSIRPLGGFGITIGDHGTRSNGETPPRSQRPFILAVGDSFAFGDGVDDQESWPAVLERLTGGRVINAAVPGFGLDQTVLRAEQLAAIYTPDVIIVSFIPHDVLRCEMSYWSGLPKPYFHIDSTGLHLHPAPVPPPPAIVRHVLSMSVAIDTLFPIFGHWQGPRELVVHPRGREVACLLMERLAALGRAHAARIVLLAQPQAPDTVPEDLDTANGVMTCARSNNLEVLDLFPVIGDLPPEQRKSLFPRHMSADGNRLIAAQLATFLSRAS